jgi:capsular polysaccharide biosynthesis protein
VDLGEILRVVRSRWYIMLPMMILAAVLSAVAFIVVPASYESYSTVSLLSSQSSTQIANQGDDNPFLDFNASLVATADFLGRNLKSTDAATELKKIGVTETYDIALAENAQGPFLTITVTGTDKDHVRASTATLERFAGTKLQEIQQQNDVKARDMIRMTEITPPQAPVAKSKTKIEVVIAVGVGFTALAFLVTFLVESITRSRRRRSVVESYLPGQPAGGGASNWSVLPESADAAETQPIALPRQPLPPGPASDETVVIRVPAVRSGRAKRADGRRSADDPRNANLPATVDPGERGAEIGLHSTHKLGPAPGTSSTTYRSAEGPDHRGQDAGRVNGS